MLHITLLPTQLNTTWLIVDDKQYKNSNSSSNKKWILGNLKIDDSYITMHL